MGTYEQSAAQADPGSSTLTAEIRRVLARVDAHAARVTEGSGRAPGTELAPGPGAAPLDALTACFSLTPFERDLVLLTAAIELEPTTAARCAAACGDPERAFPTFSLALAALAEPHWSALTPIAPLRRWRIVELDDAAGLTTTRLRLDERILHFLLGSPYLDARLHGQLRRTPVPEALTPSYDLAANRLAEGWTNGALVEVTGGDLRSRADL
ncbi:AAA family ATPase, partial [Streptomyces sp. 12257]|nr:AAA family ATPase [Streptomyces sp. 12257]